MLSDITLILFHGSEVGLTRLAAERRFRGGSSVYMNKIGEGSHYEDKERKL